MILGVRVKSVIHIAVINYIIFRGIEISKRDPSMCHGVSPESVFR